MKLELCGPRFAAYPWGEFATTAVAAPDPGLDEALRRLKRMLRLFRSHGRGQLAKYRGAIEHNRRTKGSGKQVLDQLLKEGVLRIDGQMYFLDPDRLSAVVGLNFQDVRTTRTTAITTQFLNRALGRVR